MKKTTRGRTKDLGLDKRQQGEERKVCDLKKTTRGRMNGLGLEKDYKRKNEWFGT